ACTKFGIPLGLHYLCLAAKIGCAWEMLKLILIILASPQPLKTSFHGIWLAQNLAFRSACTIFAEFNEI
ncbi:MAG: hypothetical protein II040_09950, partial [Muribaculaceae bacterium]|nr:hypothetical protein [Muribaculaceae bacterium]